MKLSPPHAKSGLSILVQASRQPGEEAEKQTGVHETSQESAEN